jgi:hypothetical protein
MGTQTVVICEASYARLAPISHVDKQALTATEPLLNLWKFYFSVEKGILIKP